VTWNDFRHKDEWADYRLDTPAGGDPLQPLEDKDDPFSKWYVSAEELECPRHTKSFFDRLLIWDGKPPCYCARLPAAVLAPKKKFRWWFSPKKALEGVKRDHFDHDYDDRHHFPDPACDCIACSCTCIFCLKQRETNNAQR
jgi:hypothetical protein